MAILLSTAALTSSTPSLNQKPSHTSILDSKSSPGLIKENIKKVGLRKLFVRLCVKGSQSTSPTSEKTIGKISRKGYGKGKPILSEGKDEDEDYGIVCPGCGVFMQDKDPTLPGYYQERKVKVTEMLEDEEEGILGSDVEYEVEDSDVEGRKLKIDDEIIWDSEGSGSEFEEVDDYDDVDLSEMDGFTAPGVGYGNITEATLEKGKRKRLSKAERKQLAREAQREKEEVTVCARCHSLRNYGQVKNQTAENLIPDFDFNRLISTRLMKPTGNADSTVVVLVVDCVDFDGSFPKRAAQSLFKALEGSRDGFKLGKKLPKLVLVGTKVDLLPSQISPTRLDRWI